jgi:hypothetical protein
MVIEKIDGGMVVRPISGLPKFKRNACVQVKDGTISATNRWGKTCSFPLAGAENSPRRAGGGFIGGQDIWWLEDKDGKLLLVVDLENFWDTEMGDLVRSTSLPTPLSSDQVPELRPDVFKINDVPIVPFGIACVGVGSVAVSLRWLNIGPEWVVMTVALPALIGALLCVLLYRTSRPNAEYRARLDDLWAHKDEIFAAGHENFDDYDPPPDLESGPKGTRGAPPDKIDGT